MKVTSKAEEYHRYYMENEFRKSMYVNWTICPYDMHETFSKGEGIHPSLAMQMGTINHEFQEKIFDWVNERTMWDCTTFKETYDYMIQLVPNEAPTIIKRGMINIATKEVIRWIDLYHKSDDPWYWWRPVWMEADFVKDCGWYRMGGKVDMILRHFPHRDQFEIWELKAKIHPTRVRKDLAFYYRIIDNKFKIAKWGGYGYNTGEMLYEVPKKATFNAFDKSWPKFLNDIKRARKGEELLKKPKYNAGLSGFVPPICTYCQRQIGCYADWKKEY